MKNKIKNDPYAALKYPEFRFFVLAQFLFTVSILIQEIVISYYLYEITNDPLSLGLVGLFEAVPFISLALFGGYFADKYQKKKIYLSSFFVVLLVTVILMVFLGDNSILHLDRAHQPWVIYVGVLIFGIARGFYNPAWSSLKPFLVKPEHYSNSASWSAQFWQVGRIAGPVIGGFLYAYIGLMNSLWVVLVLLLATIFFASQIAKKPVEAMTKTNIFESLREGLTFVKSNKILYYSIVLDMFSVLFGGVIAILPVYAKDILHVGVEGLGVMRAAPGIGAVLTMLGTAYYPPTNKAWRNMLLGVAGFGVATLVFAVSENFIVSCIALFLTGAFDSISVVVRSTILQILPPDNMRGRVSSVNGIFVSTSNELGAFESGVAAKLLGPVNSVVFGGVMTLVVVGYIYSKSKELFGVKLIKEIST
jgi:MFS family permease